MLLSSFVFLLGFDSSEVEAASDEAIRAKTEQEPKSPSPPATRMLINLRIKHAILRPCSLSQLPSFPSLNERSILQECTVRRVESAKGWIHNLALKQIFLFLQQDWWWCTHHLRGALKLRFPKFGYCPFRVWWEMRKELMGFLCLGLRFFGVFWCRRTGPPPAASTIGFRLDPLTVECSTSA